MTDSILNYEKLVYSIVSKYSYNKNDLEDLYQVGMIALQKALENYKEGYNSKFSTYAHFYIKGEILKYIRENRLIKINKDYMKLNNLINKTKEVLTQKNMKEPSLEEIASFLEISTEKVIEANMANEYVKSLDYELNDEGRELDLYDSVGYIETGYDDNIIDLKNELEKLDNNEKKLITLRYYEDKTQQETSRELGMSQVQVSRSETKILTKLRTKLAIYN
ncbi:MAG: sigma-70 family RNA polymerase sigma factor [Bacilli bacterium]